MLALGRATGPTLAEKYRAMATPTTKHITPSAWFENILRSLVVAGVPLVGVAACECAPEDRLYLISETDPSVAALVQACRRPGDAQCLPLCEFVSGARDIVHCELHTSKEGYLRVHVGSEPRCPGGRRPGRLRFAKDKAGSPVAAWIARMSQLEAASVPAFRRLANHLRHYGAPDSLVDGARSAVRDEIGHARALRAIARARGARPGTPHCPALPGVPMLAQLARANEVEGCVRESYGALVAAHQGAIAADVQIKAAMAQIAPDELRHAQLARGIREWILPKLSPTERHKVQAAGLRELRRLATAAPLPEQVRVPLGFPCAGTSRLMLEHLKQGLA